MKHLKKLPFPRKWTGLMFLFSLIPLLGASQTIYEAEAYSSKSGVNLATNHAGYSGTGFMDYGGNGTWLEWNSIDENGSGQATLIFRYANGSSGDRKCEVTVNGSSAGTLDFTKTGAWTNWDVTPGLAVSLNSGTNTIRLTAITSAGGPNLDYVEVTLETQGGTTTTLWNEDFSLPDGTQSDNGSTAWSVDISNANPGPEYEVYNGSFRVGKTADANQNKYVELQTENISITGYTADISLSLKESGALESSGDWSDYVQAYYKVDGGQLQLIVEQLGDFPSDNTFYTFTASGITGNNLQIIVRAKTTTASYVEMYAVDDIVVTGTANDTTTNPGNYPDNNPVADFYGTGSYSWSDNLNWSNVVSIEDFGGNGDGVTDNLTAFDAAQSNLVSSGGGVIYFPAGTYYFSDDLYLKSGIIIRGEEPSGLDAKSSSFDPPTNFEFPAYVFTESGSGTDNSTAFKFIKLDPTDANSASNVGVVFVDINRAGISLSAADKANATGENLVVFGVRTNNVGSPTPGVPNLSKGQHAYQRHCYRFTYNIVAYNSRNILIANTRHNDNITDNYTYQSYIVDNGGTPVDLTDGKVKFNYTDHYVIEAGQGNGGCSAGTPTSCPENFREGIVIRDNWMFHTMRTAILARGQGLEIIDNVIRDQENKVHYVHPAGVNLVGNANTLENRAIDWGGWDVLVSGNDYMVRRHRLKEGPYYSVDGEGILIQECCGGTTTNGLEISNNIGDGGYIGLYKVRDINDVLISGNTLNAAPQMSSTIMVLANTNNANYAIYNTDVVNNDIDGDIIYAGSGAQGSGNDITGNTGSGGKIQHSCAANVSISGNSGFTILACDNTGKSGAIKEDPTDASTSLGIIYPNPANESFTIQLNSDNQYAVSIYTLNGSKVFETFNYSRGMEIDVHALTPGLYQVVINDGSNVKIEKLTIK